VRQGFDRTLALTAAWGLFGLCCILPLASMLTSSVGAGAAATLTDALSNERQSALLGHTLSLGTGTVAGALCAGFPLGVALARCDAARVRLARVALIVPLVLPPYVLAFAWIALVERYGFGWPYGHLAATVILSFSLYPIVMLATEAGLRSLPSHLEEAGRLVASPAQVWLKILLPLLFPAVAASSLVVFVLATSDFAVPSMLRARVYTTEVFTAFTALYDFRLATLMALPLGAMGSIAGIAGLAISRRVYSGRTEHGPLCVRWSPHIQRVASAILITSGLVVVTVPAATIAAEARLGSSLFGDTASLQAVSNGVLWSLTAATIAVLVGALLGYWRSKSHAVAGHLTEAAWVGLFALPATIVGIGVIGVWNRPGLMGDIYRTDAIVVLAYVSRFLPLAALLSAAYLKRLPPAAEEAAILAGASWTRAFRRIVLPLSGRGLAAVWLVMFILMFGDISLAILVSPPGESNLPVRAYTLIANSPVPDVAMVALTQIVLTVFPLIAIVLVLRKTPAAS
jgi:iron(III) transport system permease protein